MKNYWFSFSHKGENKGVCIVQAENVESALQKTIDLGIHPENDDVAAFEMEHFNDDPDLEFNRLYSREEMMEMGYIPRANIVK